VSDYLYSLLTPLSTSIASITITNPTNQSVNVGQNATFSVTVSVSNGQAYTVQWFRNGLAIPGANSTTYTLTNAQLTDSGAQFSAIATASGVGSATSLPAQLTVTSSIIGFYYFGSTDYSTQLLGGTDAVPYNGQFSITPGQPLSINLPGAAQNTYMVFKYPATETSKTQYSNPPLNIGVIPSIAWEGIITIGSWKYIVTRTGNVFGLNSSQPITFS
jgi:hypothetical protein